MRQPIIRLCGVTRMFQSNDGDEVAVLDGVDLDIIPGTLTVIRGESGSGKTTLLRILGMLDQGFDGEYFLGGEAVHDRSDWVVDELRANNVGFIFQEGRLFKHMSIAENVGIPLLLHHHKDRFDRKSTVDGLAEMMFRSDELERGIMERLPANVSGGQKQRASIMRAMIATPGIILADEPTASLHPTMKGDIVAKLCELRDAGYTVIVVSHDEVFYGLGRQIEIVNGKLHERSAGEQAAADAIEIRTDLDGKVILWGWAPRAPFGTLLAMAWREAFTRPLFMVLILVSLVLGVCQISVFGSVILGTEAFIDRTMTQGSRLNRIEIKPRATDLDTDDKFPMRTDLATWANVSDVVPRRTATISIVTQSGATVPFPGMGLLPDDPEYRLLDFVGGGRFTDPGDQLEVIVTAALLGDLFDTSDLRSGKARFSDFIGKPVNILVPQFTSGGKLKDETPVRLKISGIILNGESGRQIYLPNITLRVIDRFKRDRTNEFDMPVNNETITWTDSAQMARMADWAWEDKLHIYSSEIRQIVPVFRDLSQLGYRPESDIWSFKWALDIQDTAWSVFVPLLVMIVLVVSVTIFANVFTSAKLREGELALWRVLGMRRGDLVSVQVLATVMLVAVGALIGLMVGGQLLAYVRGTLRLRSAEAAVAPGAQPLDFDALFAPISTFALALMIGALIVSVAAALYPAIRASRVDPARVLGE